MSRIRTGLANMVLRFKYRLGYDPAKDDKLPLDLLVTDPAKHFRNWARYMPKGQSNQVDFD